MWPLVHGIDRYEYRGIADRERRHTPYRRLRMAVMVDVGIIQHDLTPAAQRTPAVGLAFHEAIDDAPLEVFRPGPFRQLDTGVAAAAIGDPAVFVSVDAMHQGPQGGGPVIAIIDAGE